MSEENAQATESQEATVDLENEASNDTAKPKKPRVTTVEPNAEGDRTEPKAGSKKDIVYQAGRAEGGGSIKACAATLGSTESNVRQHITQCKTKLGFGYTIEGDNFTITGEPTITQADLAKIDEEKKAAAAAKKAAAAKAKAEAAEASGDSEASDPASDVEVADEEPEFEDDDFMN